MDEIAAVRSFRSRVPKRDDAARAAALSALEVALAEPAPVVLRRWWRSRRTLVLAAAALVAVAAVSSAFGWPARVLDVIAGEPAPPRVKTVFALEDEASERVLPIFRRQTSVGTIVEQAHGVIGIDTSVGPVNLWAAPTRGGGVCWIVEIERLDELHGRPTANANCNPRPMRKGIAISYSLGRTRVVDGYLDLIEGRVSDHVASVELHYANGETETLAVVEGFFLHEPRARPTALVARDRGGVEIERRQVRAIRPIVFPTVVGPERVLIRLTTASGWPLTFSIAPAENDALCQFTRFRGTVSRGCGRDPRTRVAPDELSVHPGFQNEAQDGNALVTLNGVVGSAIAGLELEYTDGSVVPVPVTEQFVLFEIPPEHHTDERFVLVGRDDTGKVLARRVVN